ncbi:hypothetical protein F511_01954 [Dorcoceras hygrometricum]|uniref:Uncharacterized protein n=1 Tax=Dorcoceras hygrometricum TaxID=472368 RepID=A0A2Z7ASZ5_9LAMI|nr:hypothetical protein F511_01954 [Dorcoceras hygrometricum]
MAEENAEISSYEHFREERIKENLQRMQKLGIFDLSLNFKSLKKPIKSHRKSPRSSSLSPSSAPVRRSSRLQNSTPVNYSEAPTTEKETSLEVYASLREEGSKAEFYTDKDEKLLGRTETSWTLFVDGYGKDRKRIYDPISSLGYKSVAHYLMQTHRSNPDLDKTSVMKVPVSAKRSLPFSDLDATPQEDDDLSRPDRECSGATNNPQLTIKNNFPCTESSENHNDIKPTQPEVLCSYDEHNLETTTRQLTLRNEFLCTEASEDHKDFLIPKPEVLCSGDEQETGTNQNSVASETRLESTKKRAHLEPSTDSIAGRLRQRRRENLKSSGTN